MVLKFNNGGNEMKIYVGTYQKYNEGSIEGKWLNLSDYSDKDEFYAACVKLHKNEHDPEFMFQDYENIPNGFVDESWVSSTVWDIIDVLDDMDDNGKEAFLEYLENINNSDVASALDEAIEYFEEKYRGCYNSMYEFAENEFDELYLHEIPENLQHYIDYNKYANDCEAYYYITDSGHVFEH